MISMSRLVLEAYLTLIVFDLRLKWSEFRDLHEMIRNFPLSTKTMPTNEIKQISYAVDIACVWYWKRALCLQRSAVLTCLLRRHGTSAQMVIGSRPLPFQAHAWVEVAGEVVNDKPKVREIYTVLDRC